jgi:hypothetical protein
MPRRMAKWAVSAEQMMFFIGPGLGNALSVAISTSMSKVLKDSL